MASVTDQSRDELMARADDIKKEIEVIDRDNRGKMLDKETEERWNGLNEEYDEILKTVRQLDVRAARVAEMAEEPENREDAPRSNVTTRQRVPSNIYDVAAYRSFASSPEEQRDLFREGAMRSVDDATFPHERAKKEEQQEHIERLLDQHKDATENNLAERILITGSPVYKRAFSKKIVGREVTAEEQAALTRAASLTTTAGGFAVPYVLDPSIILTSNGAVNPMRQIARIVNTTVNDWKGVSSAGVTASYDGEAVEVSDDTPTLAQPASSAVGARAFVPFSIEIGQDWASFSSEMARLFQDAKDVLEANKFIVGTGSGQPEGVYTGATLIVSSAVATTLAVGDLYSLDNALPARFHPNASILGNRMNFNRIRAFDTGGGGSLWVQLREGLPSRLLGLPNYEVSDMTSTIASGASVFVIGDFSNYLIHDRLGMEVELIPHLFATANNLPSGQRGLFAIWRNNGKVLTNAAFRTLKIT